MPGPGSERLSQLLGTTRAWAMTVRTASRVPVPFSPTDPLVAEVSRGKSQPVLFNPGCEWTDSDNGVFQLTITAGQLAAAGIIPDVYHLVVRATPGDGQPRGVYDGQISFSPTAGNDALPPSYATLEDLQTFAPEILVLKDRDKTLSGFADQRYQARAIFEQARLDLYRPQAGRSRRYLDDAGTGPGPNLVYAGSPDGSPAPSGGQVKAWFDAGKLLLTRDIVEANAHYAAALVFQSQPGDNNPYAALGARHMAKALRQFLQCVVEFDSTQAPPASPTHRIDRDVTYMT